MAEILEPLIAPVIIPQNAREEVHLTLRQCNGLQCVDLRMYVRDHKRNRVIPTEKGTTIYLKFWRQFRTAVLSPETWNETLPYWEHEMLRQRSRGRSIFPSGAFRLQNLQEQIYLEHTNFRGITFIFFTTLRSRYKHSPSSKKVVTIGPILWSQFMMGLNRMEELLLKLGFLSRKGGKPKSGLKQRLA